MKKIRVGWLDVLLVGLMGDWMVRCSGVYLDGWMDEWMDDLMKEWLNGWVDWLVDDWVYTLMGYGKVCDIVCA